MKQVANRTSTFYLWSSVFGQPALELNSSGSVVRAYVFSSSGQRIAQQASNGSFYWVHGDHLGSSHKLTDTSGNVAYTAEYDPHGNLRFESGTTTLTPWRLRIALGCCASGARPYSSFPVCSINPRR